MTIQSTGRIVSLSIVKSATFILLNGVIGVYFYPLYSNYREFLTSKIKEKELQPLEILSDWKIRWLRKSSERIHKLKKENRVNKDILFHENITEEEMDNWLSSRGVN